MDHNSNHEFSRTRSTPLLPCKGRIHIPADKHSVSANNLSTTVVSKRDAQMDLPPKVKAVAKITSSSSADAVISSSSNELNFDKNQKFLINAGLKAGAQKFSEVMEYSLEKNVICVCCGDVFLDVRLLTCGHLFCKVCIEKWLKTRIDYCPTCRANVHNGTLAIESKKLDSLFDDLEILRSRFQQVTSRSKRHDLQMSYTLQDASSLENERELSTMVPTLVPWNRMEFVLATMNYEIQNQDNDNNFLYAKLFPAEPTNDREAYKQLYLGGKFGLPLKTIVWKDIFLSFGICLLTYTYLWFIDDVPEETSADWIRVWDWQKCIYNIAYLYIYICCANLYAIFIRNFQHPDS